MNRRDLLRFALAAPVLGACGGDDSKPPVPEPTSSALEAVGAGAAPGLQVISAEAQLLAGGNRFAFGLAGDDGPVLGAKAMVYVGRDQAAPPEVTVEAKQLTELIADRGLYVATVPYPKAGDYLAAVVATTTDGVRLKGGTRFSVTTSSPSPAPGQRTPGIVTPTSAKPAGADPLCSRRPVCTMHETSLDAALKLRKPIVVVFAAPAFCVTELCGPDVDIVQDIARATGDSVTFIHVEAYSGATKPGTGSLAAPLKALKFDSEPWTYFIDAGGVVRDRISGAFGSEEIRDRVARLLKPGP